MNGQINTNKYAVYGGEVYSRETVGAPSMDDSPLVQLKTVDLTPRFVITLGDKGLEPLGLRAGDNLIFKYQRWPTKDEEVCYCIIGDEAIIRMVDGVLSHDVALRVPRDTFDPIELTPQDFHVMGVLVGIVDRDEPFETVSKEDLYYGVYSS